MDKYLQQLLADLLAASREVTFSYIEDSDNPDLREGWISEEEEEKIAPKIALEEWTGIGQDQLPPADLLTDEQIEVLYKALDSMLAAYNNNITFLFPLPTRQRYEVVRAHFRQDVLQKRWHTGFFDLCFTNKSHSGCLMGDYCHCAYFEAMSKGCGNVSSK